MKQLIILLAFMSLLVSFRERNETNTVPINSYRYRIISNSNRESDIKIKNDLSIYIQDYLYKLVNNSKDINNILLSNKDNIKDYIDNYLKENNIDIDYQINIGKNYFPHKYQKGINYLSGLYDSIVITLGEGKGLNWWCVLYPPLCTIDETIETKEYTTLAQEIINKYV